MGRLRHPVAHYQLLDDFTCPMCFRILEFQWWFFWLLYTHHYSGGAMLRPGASACNRNLRQCLKVKMEGSPDSLELEDN